MPQLTRPDAPADPGVTSPPSSVDADVLRKVKRRMAVGGLAVAVALVVGLSSVPGSLLNVGCPDLSALPIATTTQPLLAGLGDARLRVGGGRSIEEVLDGRAKHDALISSAKENGATSAWTEEWSFADGDRLVLDRITFDTEGGAELYAAFDRSQHCRHKIAEHKLAGSDNVVVQANRPGDRDGWELLVARGRNVDRLYVISSNADLARARLARAAALLERGDSQAIAPAPAER